MQSDKVLRERGNVIVNPLKAATKEQPVSAATLAQMCGIHGQRETQRRRIREVIDYLREQGLGVVGDGHGYWMGTPAELHQYLAQRKLEGKREFAATRDFAAAVSDRTHGQETLFAGSSKPRRHGAFR